MHAPQLIYLAIELFGLGIATDERMRNKPKSFAVYLVACIIDIGLLWWGGFFG